MLTLDVTWIVPVGDGVLFTNLAVQSVNANIATTLISDNFTRSVVSLSLCSDVFRNSRVPLTLDGPPVVRVEDVVILGSQLLHLSLLRSKEIWRAK